MLGRDINAPPVTFTANWEAAAVYRTWIVEGEPDYTGAQYTGLKSGDSPLVDIVAYLIPDDQVLDFNLPDPEVWETTRRVLPERLYDSSLAIIGEFAYLFGGTLTDKIFKANINTPTEWTDTGATLPGPLFCAQLAIVDGYIYLFGGGDNDGYQYSTDVIYRAPTSNPLDWEDTGFKLPDDLAYSQLAIIDGYLYLYGGEHETFARNVIYKASTDTPWLWTDTGALLPQPMYGHQLCVAGDRVWLIGGLDFVKNKLATIYSAPLSDPTNFTLSSIPLPLATAFGQIVFIGNRVYYVGGYGTGGSILRAKLDDLIDEPLFTFKNRGVLIPGTVTHSQLAVIYDRILLLGGNGSDIIWASGNRLKYKLTKQQVIDYGNITRTEFDATADPLDLFNLLGFPPWKTDYGSY